MGSFGLPALAIKPPEQPDLLGNIGKVSQLQNIAQQHQLGQQAIQEGNLKLKDAQRAEKDRQLYGSAFIESKGNSRKALDLAISRGVSPDFVMQAKDAIQKQDIQTADLVTKQGAAAAQQADIMKGAHDAVDNADPKAKPYVYQQQRAGLAQMGLDVSQLPPQYPGDEQFKYIGAAVVGHKQAVEDHLKNQQAQEAAALQQQHGIETQQKALTLAGTSPTGVTAEQQQQQADRVTALGIQKRNSYLESVRVKQEGDRLQQQKNDKGTWSVQEDPTGKPILFNNKSGEVKDAPAAIAKPGTYQKNMGGAEESVQYAKDYLGSQNFTGPGDEALMEKFFDVAKPSTGFRMTQPQMNMLNGARDAYQGLIAKGKHLLSPNAPYFDDTQREHIVKTMDDIIKAKREVRGGSAPSGAAAETRTYQGATYAKQPDGSWKKQ
jgi:hypothetical protein